MDTAKDWRYTFQLSKTLCTTYTQTQSQQNSKETPWSAHEKFRSGNKTQTKHFINSLWLEFGYNHLTHIIWCYTRASIYRRIMRFNAVFFVMLNVYRRYADIAATTHNDTHTTWYLNLRAIRNMNGFTQLASHTYILHTHILDTFYFICMVSFHRFDTFFHTRYKQCGSKRRSLNRYFFPDNLSELVDFDWYSGTFVGKPGKLRAQLELRTNTEKFMKTVWKDIQTDNEN